MIYKKQLAIEEMPKKTERLIFVEELIWTVLPE